MDKQKVLLIEDEQSLAEILKELLEKEGFEVALCFNGSFAYARYLACLPDIIIMDVMLPGENGFSITRKIRSENRLIPILFLTARTMTDDIEEGFESGANDYLKKPFDTRELVIRLKVLLNQNRLLETPEVTSQRSIVEIGHYQFDILKSELHYKEKLRQLTAREAEILKILYHHRFRSLSRKELLMQAWGNDDFFSSRSLDVFISKLRRYLTHDPRIRIINQKGVGYRLIC